MKKEGVTESALEFITNARREWARRSLEDSAEQYHSLVGQLQKPHSDLAELDEIAWRAAALIEPVILANRFFFSSDLLRNADGSAISVSEAYMRLCREHGRLITFDDELPEFPPQGSDHWNANHAVLYLLFGAGLLEQNPRLDLLEGLIVYFRPNLQQVSDDALRYARWRINLIAKIRETIRTHPGSSAGSLGTMLGETEDEIAVILSALVSAGRMYREWRGGQKKYYLRA